jgi:hypothetical protein
MRTWSRLAFATLVLAVALSSACDKASHENIDKWRNTEKGPAKLESALRDSGLDMDLRAHAAEALVGLGMVDKVKPVVASMSAGDRARFFQKVTPRLWDAAKTSDADQAPVGKQLRAKDGLFILRSFAEGAERDAIDQNLLDWLTAGGYYEQRAPLGDVSGEQIIRAIGVKAGPKMVQLGQDLVKQQKEAREKGQILIIGKNTLRGIAFTGAPEAVGFLIELASTSHPQENLQVEAMFALDHAYVQTQDEPKVDPLGLAPHAQRLEKLALDESAPGEVVNIAYELLVRVPAPACLPPLVRLATQRDLVMMLRAIDFSMRCGGADAVVPVAEAMPIDGSYERGIIEKYIVDKIPVAARGPAAESARALLGSPSWAARFVGVEILAKLGDKADAAKLRALSGDKARLKGYWGDQTEVPKKEQKAEPTLGQRAVEVAEILEKKP